MIFLVGGAPTQCELITDYISMKAKDSNGVKVYSFVEDMAASGGYWLACAGEKIYVKETSVVGSIGVVSAGFGFNHAIDALKVERRVMHAGKNKILNDPFLPKNEDGQKILTRILDQIHQSFIQHVKSGRGDRIKEADFGKYDFQLI